VVSKFRDRFLIILLIHKQIHANKNNTWPAVSYKVKDTCYSATYMSQTRDQQRFTISEVAADWHKLMVAQRIMWLSIARANGQLDTLSPH